MVNQFTANCEAFGDRLLKQMSRWWKPKVLDEAARQKRVRWLFKWSPQAFALCLSIAFIGVYTGTLSSKASVGYFTLGLLITKPVLILARAPHEQGNVWRLLGIVWFGNFVIDLWQPQPHSPFATLWQSGLFGAYEGIYWVASLHAGTCLLLWLFREPFLPFVLTVSSDAPNPTKCEPDTSILPADY